MPTDLLKKSAPSRIIFNSNAYAFCSNLNLDNLNYPKDHPVNILRSSLTYANSKLANVIIANGFAKKLNEFGVTSNSLHPGLINTDNFLMAPKYEGIQTVFRILRGIVLLIYGKVSTNRFYTNVTDKTIKSFTIIPHRIVTVSRGYKGFDEFPNLINVLEP